MPALAVFTPLFLAVGAVALFLGAWRIFRPTEAWAGVLAALGSAAGLVPAVYDAATLQAASTQPALTYWTGDLARIASFAWISLESFAHFRLMRRRHRIGLAEPALANRFLMWGMAAASGALVVTASMVNWLVFPRGTVGAPILLIQSVLGFVASTLIWLTFYPPRVLEGVLLQRAGAGAGSDG
jgi:hypothetical protein